LILLFKHNQTFLKFKNKQTKQIKKRANVNYIKRERAIQIIVGDDPTQECDLIKHRELSSGHFW